MGMCKRKWLKLVMVNVHLCCGGSGDNGGASPDHTRIALSGGRDRNIIMLPRSGAGSGTVNSIVFFPFYLLFSFSDLSAT